MLLSTKYASKFLALAATTPLKSKLESLKPQLAAAAQTVYDDWNADSEHGDWQVGFGGICHLIADKMVDVIVSSIPDIKITTISSSHEVHVYVICGTTETVLDGDEEYLEEDYYSVDIRPHLYEKGGGYNWTKIPDVIFDPSFISIDSTEPLELDENGDVLEIY